MKRAALVWCLALNLAGGAPAGARQAPQGGAAPAGAFGESVDVDLVSIEVFVFDREGHSVRGLKQQDFKVTDDGKPVEISHFVAMEETPAPRARQGPAATAPPPSPASGQPAAPPQASNEQRLDLAVLVDNLTLVPASRNRVLQAVRAFLSSHLSSRDRVLVASYDRSLRIVQEPTTDRQAALAAIDEVTKGSAGGFERDTDLRQIDRKIAQAAAGGRDAPYLRTQAYDDIRSYAQKSFDETRAALETLTRFVDGLSGLPGRKALLYLSGGIDLHPGQAMYDTYRSQFSSNTVSRADLARGGGTALESRELDVTPLLRRVAEHANASRVTFYTLSAEEDISGRGAETATATNWSLNAGTEKMNRQESLRRLADDTGGTAGLDLNNPSSFLAQMQSDLESYYSLGYPSPHPHDGKLHKVKIATRDGSLRLRHREQYLDRTGSEHIRDLTVSTLLFGVQDNPLGLAVNLLAERPDRKGQVELDLLVKVPMSRVVLLPRRGSHDGQLTIYVASRGRDGRTSDVSKIEVPVRVPEQQWQAAASQVVAYRARVRVRAEETDLAIGLRDELGKAESTLRVKYVPTGTARK
ncbi:MAG TPA: VWA domain-containing protein [Thermoanaerobaculia bacterium]|nr:VWA domain-containing protein [Thermoanaerobaculia bacterium]